VAQLGVAVARALGLDGHAQTTVRLGAYLHDSTPMASSRGRVRAWPTASNYWLRSSIPPL